jgi:hypothetical protein
MRRFLLVSLVLLAVFSLKSVCFADPFLNLPTSAVKATFDFNHSLDSYWKITLDSVPVSNDVADGTYASWCVDVDLSVGGSKWVFLIESYDERLFAPTTPIDTSPDPDVWDTSNFMPNYNRGNTWIPTFPNEPASNGVRHQNTDLSTYGAQDKVNWILNNWQTVMGGDTNPANVGVQNGLLDWKEIQTAIWYFVDGIHASAWTWNDDSKALIDKALTSTDGYVGEKIGVILYIAGDYNINSVPTFSPTALGQGQYVMISVDRPVPEPGTLLMLSSGLLGLMGYGKLRLNRKKRS